MTLRRFASEFSGFFVNRGPQAARNAGHAAGQRKTALRATKKQSRSRPLWERTTVLSCNLAFVWLTRLPSQQSLLYEVNA